MSVAGRDGGFEWRLPLLFLSVLGGATRWVRVLTLLVYVRAAQSEAMA